MTLQQIVDGAKRIVFFSGAGISTESGIPDFRSADGIYNIHSSKYSAPPEEIVSNAFLLRHPDEFFDFYRERLLCLGAEPNPAHYKLAELERAGKLFAVVTQNIDGLHEKAGSKNVLELHGSIWRNHCMTCGRRFGVERIAQSEGIPRCECGGVIRPDVVLFGEALDADVVDNTLDAIATADILIIGGTSLSVYPAADFVRRFKGDKLVIINRDATPMDSRAGLVLRGNVGEVLGALRV